MQAPEFRPAVGPGPIIIGQLRSVLTGPARAYTRPGSRSGIDKHPQAGAVAATASGLHGDEQGDLRVHGGPDKAIHVYPWTHYSAWRHALAGNRTAESRLQRPGAFGENFSVEGHPPLDEATVCIGDRWAIGEEAVFEVSQGRQPCWKLNDRFDQADMAARVQAGGRTGWYLRVSTPGAVRAGDAIRRIERPWPGWPLARLLALIASRTTDPLLLREALCLPLPPSWQTLFTRRLASGEAEAWARRMEGPPGLAEGT
ncbi:MOSC domain-containing protein [Rhizobacter sp. LjRoot28]|uniref:MOSC domain-containing protein n=1 Tax=Rhizobacter sp. LjRoot28 TaxID=3342309 RepID=UPI003ECEADB9